MAKTKTTGKRGKTTKAATPPPMPRKIFAQASPMSVGGLSMFDAVGSINQSNFMNYQSEPELISQAVSKLQKAGFEILHVSAFSINIAGTKKTFERAFDTELYINERPVIKELGEEDTAAFIDCPNADLAGLIDTSQSKFRDILEGVAIEEPRYYMAPSMYPPCKSYWHLRVPAGVSLATNADKAHRAGTTGRGIKVAMVDSGHYKHPFFVGRGYRVAPVVLGPAAANPLRDESGHGTGESANIFAVAPDVDFLPVKMSFVNSLGAFNAAVDLHPDIITCSWGSSIRFGPLSAANQALAAAVASAWAAGIVVIFSAGNGHWGFPGQHPDVISAGGVYMKQDESLKASDYASGFMSNIYRSRRVPDLSGLVGMRPKAMYIMLPVEPGDDIDSRMAGGSHPATGDETTGRDGWAAFSGTSAAAPQLAGAAALVKQACPRLTPSAVRDVLMRSARDVKVGSCHPNTGGNAAVNGPDTATGNGLVDAYKATLLAKLRCITITPHRGVGRIPRIPPEPIRTPGIRHPLPEPRRLPPGPPIYPPVRGGLHDDLVSLEDEAGARLTEDELTALEEMIVNSDTDF